jgi:dTDP-4-dehydrorhamnose reductase
MSVLVTGAGGLVGRALCALPGVIGRTHRELDILDPVALSATLDQLRPRALINAAAQAGVDRADREPYETFRVNAEGPALLARLCAARGVRLVHISTDYVLSGADFSEFLLTEELPPLPRSTYAASKWAGEPPVLAAGGLVARVQWVYAQEGSGFFARSLQAIREGRPLRLVHDQWGAPTPASLLARWLMRLAEPGPTGLFHLATIGATTPLDWLTETAHLLGLPLHHQIISRTELAGAFRPARSCLSPALAARTFSLSPPTWQHALATELGF